MERIKHNLNKLTIASGSSAIMCFFVGIGVSILNESLEGVSRLIFSLCCIFLGIAVSSIFVIDFWPNKRIK